MKLNNISFGYDNDLIIKDFSYEFKRNKITTIIGSNGCGKSTLLKIISQQISSYKGNIEINNQDIKSLTKKQLSKKIAYVGQKTEIYEDIKVITLLHFGRLPHHFIFDKLNKEDLKIIDWAIKITNVKELLNRNIKSLSGGQLQRVYICLALIQKSEILLLDEPITYLDIKYQIEIIHLIKQLKQLNITVIMVHHDINQAMAISDEIIGIKDGKILFAGGKEVINETNLDKLYDINLNILNINNYKVVLNV